MLEVPYMSDDVPSHWRLLNDASEALLWRVPASERDRAMWGVIYWAAEVARHRDELARVRWWRRSERFGLRMRLQLEMELLSAAVRMYPSVRG